MDIDEIIERYQEKLYKLCLFYLKNPEEARDLLQDIFIKILRKQSSFKGESGLYTWIYRIAVNTLINHINRKKLVEFISFGPAHETPSGSSGSLHAADPAVNAEGAQRRERQIRQLEECMETLSNREKTAFYFFHYDGLKHAEIAEIMNTSVSAVQALVHKGMKKIKGRMKAKLK